jgi:uncharacterized protein (DUF488 family)
MERIYTIGAYGLDAEQFLAKLHQHGVNALIDVRLRRGMRGSAYAWANARRLQGSLEASGIAYAHARELAPTPEVREVQHAADRSSGTGKRARQVLSPSFRDAYHQAILDKVNPGETGDWLAKQGDAPALFCVERSPDACHRSLIADWLRREGQVLQVIHIEP